MKITIPALASLALALAPAAHAQVSCSEVSAVIGYAEDDFEDISGDEIDDDLYEATFALNGSQECSVDYTLDSVYSCLWVFDSQAAAASAYTTQYSTVSRCLSGWTTKDMTPEATANAGYRVLQGAFVTGSGDASDLEWAVILEEHTVDSATDWHVAVGLAYLW